MAGVSSETKSPLSDAPVPLRALQHCWVRCLSAQSSCDPNDSPLTGSDFLSAPGRAELLEAGTVGTERGEAMPQGRRGCSAVMSNLRHPELFLFQQQILVLLVTGTPCSACHFGLASPRSSNAQGETPPCSALVPKQGHGTCARKRGAETP